MSIPESESELDAGVRAALAQRGRKSGLLDSLSPQQREDVARWIESRYANFPQRIADAERLIRQGVDVPGLAAQLQYWRVAMSVSKQLAHFVRVYRTLRMQS